MTTKISDERLDELIALYNDGVTSPNYQQFEVLIELKRARTDIKDMREALEFYGSADHWQRVTIHDRAKMNVDDLELTDSHEDYYCRQGGKRARQCLTKIKERNDEV